MCLLNRKINEATIMPSYRFINEATGFLKKTILTYYPC